MKISVLMTVFNGGRYLLRALDSVLRQSYRDFEFVIVDDCSRDDTLKVLKSCRDPRIRLIANAHNCGQTASLNIGLHACRAEWVARIDADDVAFPEWLGFQLALAGTCSQAAVISSQAGVINQGGWVRQSLEIPCDYEGMLLRSLTASPLNHGGCLLSREIALRYGGYDESYRILADQDLWCRMIRGGERFLAGGKMLMAIRFHDGSISTVQRDQLACAETIRVMRHHYEFMTGRLLPEAELTGLWKLCYRAEQLSADELGYWLKVLREVFISVKRAGLTVRQLENAFVSRARVFCVKRALACLADGDVAGVRKVCLLCDQMTGSFRGTSILRVAATCGVLGRMLEGGFHFHRFCRAAVSMRRWRVL